MAEADSKGKPAEQDASPPRRINLIAVGIGVAIFAVAAVGIFSANYYVDEELKRDRLEWQVRLGIVADSRAAAVNEWVEQNFADIRELVENASLQLYMTELDMFEGDKSEVTDEPAQASYLRNLLIATADRTGFTPPAPVGEVAANIEIVGVAGLGLTDADGRPIVSTPAMPPFTGKIRTAIAKALGGEPALIDIYMGASNLPTMGFALPVFGVQDDAEGAEGIGVVVGIRTIGKDLYDRLDQPGQAAETAETYLVRAAGGMVEFLSPLADGTPPLKRSFAIDTEDLAASFAIKNPGGFKTTLDYASEEVLITSRPLADLPWVLIRKISRAEALAATETRLRTILVVFVLIIIGVSIAIVAVWRHGSSVRATLAAEKSRIAAERFENMSKFMNLVTNSQPTQIVAVTGDTKYTFANQPATNAAGIPLEDMMGKTMASVLGPIKAKTFEDINLNILAGFAETDDTTAERQQHIHTFGSDDDDDVEFQVVKSDHIPLRGDRDYPPGVLMVFDDITELTRERRRNEKRLNQLIGTLVSVVDRRDPFSVNHSSWVAEVAGCIGNEMDLPKIEIKALEIAGRLMNLGKIFIPPELLTKTGDLTPEERSLVATNYLVSVDLLYDVDFEGPVVETIRQMGETWDGKGPLGMGSEEILTTSSILAVANAFVGMISPRAYRGAMTFDKVSSILLDQTGTKFDRKPVSALINFLENRGGKEKWAHFREQPVAADDD